MLDECLLTPIKSRYGQPLWPLESVKREIFGACDVHLVPHAGVGNGDWAIILN